MNATAELRSEHVGVSRMLAIMEAMAARLESGQPVESDDVAQAIEFLRVFADQCHHTKEEQLLFPAMLAEAVTSARETVRILMDEHVQARAAVSQIARDAQRLAEGDPSAAPELAERVRDYTRLLHGHIRREETDCFATADAELSPEIAQDLVAGYDRIERDVVGEGRHEAFHELLDRLSAAYGL